MAQELAVLALLAAAAAGSPFPQLVPFANSTAVENSPLCVPQFVTVPAVTVTETLPASTFTEEHYMTTLTERPGPSIVTESVSGSTVTTTLTDTTTVSATTTSTEAGVRLAQVTETTTKTVEATSTKTVEETTTQTASHKVPPKIVTLPASSIYKTITKTQAPETVTKVSTATTTVFNEIVSNPIPYPGTSVGRDFPSQVTVQVVPIPTKKPAVSAAPPRESVQKLYELMRESRSFAEFFRSLPEDLKELARANPALVDELYAYFRWYEKSHEEIKGFAPKVAEDVDQECSTKDTTTGYNKGFSAIIAEAPKYDGCKAKIEKAKSEVSRSFRVKEDCSSVPHELRTGCPNTCGFYQATSTQE